MAVEGVPLEALSVRLRECELVINTAPGPVLGRAELEALTPGTPVIDLASAPGGVDCAAAAALGVRAVRAPGIPGKESPVSAGGYIRDTVYHIMKELEVQ